MNFINFKEFAEKLHYKNYNPYRVATKCQFCHFIDRQGAMFGTFF